MRQLQILFLLGLFFISCKKETESSIDFTEINSGTNYNLRCITRFNTDTLFASGGDDTHGIILISKDNGTSWNIFSTSFISRVNSVFFRNAMNGFAVCNNFLLMKTMDGGASWDSVELYHVPYQYMTNLFDVKFINDSTGYFCGGEEYSHGIIGKTSDKGQSWHFTFIDHEMRSIHFKDNVNGYCGGYGAMLYTDDGGENWQLTESNSEFITSINYTSANGIACGYQGGLLRNQNTLDWVKVSASNSVFSSRCHFNTVCRYDNTNYFVLGNDGKCAISNDGGGNWQPATSFDKNTIYDALMLSSTEGIAVGEQGKIYHFSKK